MQTCAFALPTSRSAAKEAKLVKEKATTAINAVMALQNTKALRI
jgi:hypothetical protein